MTATAKPAMQSARGIDADLWHRIRMAALARHVTMGELLNEILREWLDRQPRS